MVKKIIIMAVLILACLVNIAFSDDVFPVTFNIGDFHTSGRLIINDARNEVVSFLIKPKWEEESEVLYMWNGIARKQARGISFGNTRLLAVFNIDNSLLLVRRDVTRILAVFADSNGKTISETELAGSFNEVEDYSAEWVGQANDTTFILKVNNFLYKITLDFGGNLTSKLITPDVISVILNRKNTGVKLVYIESAEGSGTVYTDNLNGLRKPAARITLAENQFIYCLEKTIAIVSSTNDNENSLIYIIDPDNGITDNFWVESNGYTLAVEGTDSKVNICYINYSGSNYYFTIDSYSGKKRITESKTELPKETIEPLLLKSSGQYFYAVFRNNFIKLDKSGQIISMDFLPIGEYIKSLPELYIHDNYVILSTKLSSLVLTGRENTFWWFFSFMRESGKIIIPLFLLLVALLLLQFYRRQKRLLRAVLNLPSSGAVLVLDKNGRLERANSPGMNLLGIAGNLPMGKPLQYYFNRESARPVKELLEKTLEMKNTISQKVNIVSNGDSKEWYCIIVPLRTTTGFFTGLLFTAIDITEELERKRLSNWAQLAHDMQTNLSTIKLNAEQLGISDATDDVERKKKIIHQVNILMHRVRDVVTVGRTDGIDRQNINGAEICLEVKAEFDESLFPHVTIETASQNALVSCDRAKLTRALRNAVENAIRALEGKVGTITISNWTDARYAYFSIKDTGKGMDGETSEKMLKPYFTTSKKYGGMGMGTMIMQHVAELHGGKIEVVSEKGKGSEIIFSFPNYLNKRR